MNGVVLLTGRIRKVTRGLAEMSDAGKVRIPRRFRWGDYRDKSLISLTLFLTLPRPTVTRGAAGAAGR